MTRKEQNILEHNRAISESFYHYLNGRDLERKQRDAMMLLTVSEDGWPHTAMVSVGEVAAVDGSRLRLALWPGTETSRNLIRAGQAVLLAVHEGAVLKIRLAVQQLPALPDARHPRERFEANVLSVHEDRAKYAEVTSGITFALQDEQQVLRRWKETLEELNK